MEYKNNLSDLKNMLGQKRKSPNTIEDINKNPSEDVIMEPVLEGEKVSKIKKNNNLLPKNKDNNNMTVSPKRGKANTNEKKKSEKVIFFF